MIHTKRLLITPGEPAGIGPDIVVMIAQQAWPVELVVITDPTLLYERAKLLGLPLKLINADLADAPHPTPAQTLKVLPYPLVTPCVPGQLNKLNAPHVIETLNQAAALCLSHSEYAVVTGPVQKSVINEAGIPFTGHTEFFAHSAQVARTVMLFVVNQLKVALATTHIPLANVSEAVTKESLRSTLEILVEGLQTHFGIPSPHVMVCGLNPHAGENGYLGLEEITTIRPVIEALRQQQLNIDGPYPADTLFTPTLIQQADAILAMYHDQALPVVKHIGFNYAVNVTLGLPFIRTSVDHGTALAIAGTGKADPGSLQAAIKLATKIIS